MTDTADTIELLEAIGSDASLRYAQTDELMGALGRAQASAGLRAAVAASDSATLHDELGLQQVPVHPQINAPGHGDDEDDECEVPQPERDLPGHPSEPKPGSSH
jgi:hypothetical protein